MIFLFLFINLIFLVNLSVSQNLYTNGTEFKLFDYLFMDYDSNSIPVRNSSNNIELLYGHEIQGLVYFNQKDEKIKFNMLTTILWKDEYLDWSTNPIYNHIEWIFIPKYKVWNPDLELYNSASSPELFELGKSVILYKNGVIVYNRPTSVTFSCKLGLDNFPFDIQTCSMLFGSWKYPKQILNLRPFLSTYLPRIDPDNTLTFRMNVININNISVSPQFSHNEWNIYNIDVEHTDLEYKCCPGDKWPNSRFIITLKRNPQKYIIMIIMSVLITLSSLTITLINVDKYYRTYVLVFIPLTLIWLQIHTSSKIPVIENPTRLENIIQVCFYITIGSAIESGILYTLLMNHSKFVNRRFYQELFEHKMVEKEVPTADIIYKKNDTDMDINLYIVDFTRNVMLVDVYFRICVVFVFMISICYFLFSI